MRAPVLLGGPVVGAVLVALVCLGWGDALPGWQLRLDDGLIFALATAGSFGAALAFGPGDYLRRAWVLMGACYALLLVDTLAFGVASGLHTREVSASGAVVSGVITLVANVVTVVSLIIVSRAWKVAGLELSVSRTGFWALEGTLVVVTLALLGPTLWHQASGAFGGRPDELHSLASTLGDVVSLLVLGPLFLTALSLRGGSLSWTWGLLTASTLCWLGVDGAEAVGEWLHLSPVVLLACSEGLRAFGSLLQLSAGLAQRAAIQGR
jgi:uncharacterized membrane protein